MEGEEQLSQSRSGSQKKSGKAPLRTSGSEGTLVQPPPPSPVKKGGSLLSFLSGKSAGSPDGATPTSSKKFSIKSLVEDSGIFVDSEEFVKKWSGPLILGPFVPAIFAAITIVAGNITLSTWQGTCDAPLDVFVTFAVVMSYMFLLVYSWVVMGDDIYLPIPLTEHKLHILAPFRSLRLVVMFYAILALVSFILWCVGTALIQSSLMCVTTAPALFHFSLFLCVIYWLMFFCILGYVIKMKFGANIAYLYGEATRERTKEEYEEMVFKKEWMKIDTGGKYYMHVEDVPFFLSNLGIGMPEDQVESLIQSLEPTEDNRVDYFKFMRWFRSFNSSVNDEIKDRPDVDDLMAFDETAVKRRKKQKREDSKTKKDKRRFFNGDALDKYREEDDGEEAGGAEEGDSPGPMSIKSSEGMDTAQDDVVLSGEPETEEDEAPGKANKSNNKKKGKK